MADSPKRRLILGNGEAYVTSVVKAFHGRSPEPPRTYEEARERVKVGITSALAAVARLPSKKRLPNEAVFCLRLHPDATAKSYDPALLFEDVPDLRKVGSRMYRENVSNVAQTSRITKKKVSGHAELEGRLVFVQSTTAGFQRLLSHLDRRESELRKAARDEIRRIERFDILTTHEQIAGFGAEWSSGRVELVLHPARISGDRQTSFVFGLFEEAGIDRARSQVRPYPGGPTFVSCFVTKRSLESLAGVNPLRSAHPLQFSGISDLRSAPTAKAPKPSDTTTHSTIKVGMFDGGVDLTVPLLQGHVEEDKAFEIKTPARPEYTAHGTAVAGALLHGQLNGLTDQARVPAPPVYVVSIRALPTSNPKDIDLYESIDVVERTVPARKDIKVFNLSFGPRGPIKDDTISRFTYVLDSLAFTHKVTFYVAVGNDGHIADFERIQAPSDVVHGVGVGAYTNSGNKRTRAPYSCQGPGRECGKIKPDVSAFGGCEDHPIHLVSNFPGLKALSWGTSFASPLGARLGAQASESFDRSSALLGRALVVHTADHPDGEPDHHLGHGCIASEIGDILLCADKSVTIVFQGDIQPTRIVRLPLPWPSEAVSSGKVHMTWTVAALSPVDQTSASDYTSCCIEDTCYPHF
jgi:hypothetical protein